MTPPAPADRPDRLRELRRAADAGDREAIVRIVRALVPTYRDGVTPLAARQAERTSRVLPLTRLKIVESFSPGAAP
jgi:hypothetical protein